MKGQQGLSPRQATAAVWAAAAAPATGALPAMAARSAGEAGWLAPVLSLGLMLTAGWMVWQVTQRGTRTVSRTWADLMGRTGATALTIIYIMWAVILMAVRLRLSAARLDLAAQGQRGLWLYVGVTALAALWMVWGEADALGRAARVFWTVLALSLVVIILQAAGRTQWENLWPVWAEDMPGVFWAGAQGAGVFGLGIYAAIQAAPGEGTSASLRRWCGGMIVGGVVLTAVLTSLLGVLGPALVRELREPMLTLAAGMGAQGGLGRLEGLIAAVWLLSDLAALALLLGAGKRLIKDSGSGKNERLRAALILAASFAALYVAFREEEAARTFQSTWGIWGNLFLAYVLPALVYFVWWAKEGRRGKHTSCG